MIMAKVPADAFYTLLHKTANMLSIIIPTLNEEKYLPKLLESLKSQSFKDYELIVADFNSKDRTRSIAKKYGCVIVDGGMPSAARNNGAKKAKGSFLFFIDADCTIGSSFLEKALDEIKKRNLDAAGCYSRPLSSNVFDKIILSMFNVWVCITQLFYPNASFGFFCRRSLHEKIKGFDENIRLSEDMDYARRAGKSGKFRILNTVKICASARRFDEEGRLRLLLKLFLSGLYRIFFGEIKSDMFKYRFGHGK